MSKSDAVPAQPIPTGILVSVSGNARQAERPTPKRKSAPRTRAPQIPWLWIVTFGSIAWAALILTIGLCSANHEGPHKGEPTQMSALVASAPALKTVLQEERAVPDVAKQADEFEPEPAPHVAAPTLPMREAQLVPSDGMPPVLSLARLARVLTPSDIPDAQAKGTRVDPVSVEANPEEALPQLPLGARAQARSARKDIESTLYASCAQIGTNVLFMKDPTEAFKKARAENKLVFIVHLSGNLEDKEFT